MSCIDSLSEVNPDIPEDSNLYKGFACVPVAGTVVSWLQQSSLEQKVSQINRPKRVMELIETKNKYKACDIVNSTIILALTVASVAVGIIPVACLTFAFMLAGWIGWNAHQISQNREVVEQVRSGKLSHGPFPVQ